MNGWSRVLPVWIQLLHYKVHTNNNTFSSFVKFILVTLETSLTVILPYTVCSLMLSLTASIKTRWVKDIFLIKKAS